MGWNNPPLPWREMERRLSDKPVTSPPEGQRRADGRQPGGGPVPGADGGDSPAWSRKRQPYESDPDRPKRVRSQTPYAELHCHSNFSFLDGASPPEELAEEADRLGLEALAITDHDGFYGVVRFAEAARTLGLPTVFGAELTLDAHEPRQGSCDPHGEHLVVLARNPEGYRRLGRAITAGQLAGSKGAPQLSFDLLASHGGHDHWLVLSGCRKGVVARALEGDGPSAAAHHLGRLTEAFGRSNVMVELWDHGQPLDSVRNDGLVQVAARVGVESVATNNVHYAAPTRWPLATAVAAVRARRSLDEVQGWLPSGPAAHLRSGDEQARRFARYPGVVERAAELGRACAFDLRLVAPNLPPFRCPDGHDEMSWLRALTEAGAADRYRSEAMALRQIDHELEVIEALGFPGYFLVVWDIVEFCRRNDIYCQGRGSAANSAVCFALGITNVDAVGLGLLFERFLSPERDGPPDIDLDIESDRREEVIQYVYERYGRSHAAQVANVITYRARSAVRDVARAFGFAPGQQDAWSKQIDRWSGLGEVASESAERAATEKDTTQIPDAVLRLALELEHFPRHLGIHSGGMVLCDRPVSDVCPVEWARMRDRSVLQWDKDDCAAVGLVKFDLLGLGMLSALHYAIDFINEVVHNHNHDDNNKRADPAPITLATIPQEDAVYDMLCRADSVGVFQVESRARMATLPRLKPRCFYDLVVEVALIRPGPIQGGSVHPYIRRRNGEEEVTYLHPLLENSLAKTLGIPLFQEQLMQMAIDVAGFTAAEADELRQAMGSKRSQARMERLRQRVYDGMASRNITGDVADQIFDKMAAFANFGFPESHSVSFAYLVYASSWIKLHYPAAFCAALLNAQPMGFYSPHSLSQDAARHGVQVLRPDVNTSAAEASLVPVRFPTSGGGVEGGGVEGGGIDGGGVDGGRSSRGSRQGDEPGPPSSDLPTVPYRYDAAFAVQLGLSSVRSVGVELAEAIAAGRPYRDMDEVRRRSGAPLDALEALATAGAFRSLRTPDGQPMDRRQALWSAGAVAQGRRDRLPGVVTGVDAPMLPGMEPQEESLADLWATGVAPNGHPTRYLREMLTERGVTTARGLATADVDRKVTVGGLVTHRQRPATAGGTTFLNLEDETGLINVVVSKGCWQRHRVVARSSPALLIRGRLERYEGVINVIAETFEPLPVKATIPSRDFR